MPRKLKSKTYKSKTYKRKTYKSKTYKRKTYKRKNKTRGGKKYKLLACSQSIVNLPRMDCLEKHCTGSKKYKDGIKKLAKLNEEHDAFVAKKCNIELDKYGQLWPETEEEYQCNSDQRKGKRFQEILKLEGETATRKCQEKHCAKEEAIVDDCVDLEEEQCRIKYKDLIEEMRKTKKRKILPLEQCLFE